MGSLYDLTQFDGLRPEDISMFARQRFMDLIQNPTRLGERILPFVQVDDWRVESGKVSFRNVASAIIGPDSPLPRGPLGTLSEKAYDILKGGRKYALNESELRKLREVFFSNGRPSPQQIFRSRPYQLANALVLGYLDRAEQMRWEALTTGQYVIPGSGGVAVDWALDPTHQISLTGNDSWDDATNADGLADLEAFDDLIYEATGAHSAYTVMSKKQLNNLLAQTKTRQKLAANGAYGIGGQVAPAANQAIMDFFQDQLNAYLARRMIGPVVTYDRMYNEFDDVAATQPVTTRFLHEDYFVMVGETPVDGVELPGYGTATGYTADGPVVENDFAPGLYTWFAMQDEPYEVFVKSVFWTLPIIKDARTIVSGRVDAA